MRGLNYTNICEGGLIAEMDKAGKPWGDAELRATLAAYLDILDAELSGRPVNKSEIRRGLLDGDLKGRSQAAIELRMQNFSAYFADLELPWVAGYKPRGNIGADVRARVDGIFLSLSGRLSNADLVRSQAAVVHKTQQDLRRPAGNAKPERIQTQTSLAFRRDAMVVAWTLKSSGGVCELCANPAPFFAKDGLPYLEVHHVEYLANGGEDTVVVLGSVETGG